MQIIVDLLNDASTEEVLHCHTPEELSTWIQRDSFAWQSKLSEEAFADRFEGGHGSAYGCIEQMLSCINYEFALDLLVSMREPN